MVADSGYPVRLEVDYTEAPSRGIALLGVIFFVKALLLIPHLIILYFLQFAFAIAVYIGYWVVLITGRYPRGLFRFAVGFQRWYIRSMFWLVGTTDRYPPFSLD